MPVQVEMQGGEMAKKNQDASEQMETDIVNETVFEESEAEKIQKGIEEQNNEFKELAQRIQADFDNFRRRNSSVRADAHKDGVSEAVLKLLPVLDSLEAGLKFYRDKGDQKEMEEGYGKLEQQFLDQLKSLGVTQIESQDRSFDPNIHEAILQQPREGVETGMVAEVYRNGYRMGDSIIRPAQVIVAE